MTAMGHCDIEMAYKCHTLERRPVIIGYSLRGELIERSPLIATYELEGLGNDLERHRTRNGGRRSLRQLIDYFKLEILKPEIDEVINPSPEDEIKNYYNLLS